MTTAGAPGRRASCLTPSPGRARPCSSRTARAAGRSTANPPSQLDGLIDVDLEASACTNTLPIHRLPLPLGELTEAPAAYVRALDLSVARLDQTYRRLDGRRYDYTSEADFRAVLEYDAAGLIVDYPGIAVRFA